MNSEKLIYASTESSPDMLYFAKMNIPDAIFAFTHKGKKCALASPLEFGRMKKESDFDEIYPLKGFSEADELAKIFSKLKIRKVEVPAAFPSLMLVRLENLGLEIEVCEGEFFEKRRIKSEFEAGEISKANKAASEAFARVAEILKGAKIDGGILVYQGRKLTSEFLKFEIDKTCFLNGAIASQTIAASGAQACDPHCQGHGEISANSLIVCDIFPRLKTTGYFGDMTRTFLKGKPSDAQIGLVKSVKQAQDLAMPMIRAGARADSIHSAVCKHFEKLGYKTELKGGAWRGFFHSTGHGIGLEVHESPRLGRAKNILCAGEVVTVEPGLYSPEIGACRIEDNVFVEKDGCRKLSNFNYDWIIA